MRHYQIVFMDGDDGQEVVDRLANVEGVVAHGPTDESISATVDHLLQWDHGEGEIKDGFPLIGMDDRREFVTRHGRWLMLSWHVGLRYVSLNELIFNT